MGTFSLTHLLVVLIIVVLLFGTKKLRSLGSDMGNAIKGFRDSMGENKDSHVEPAPDKHLANNEQRSAGNESVQTSDKRTNV